MSCNCKASEVINIIGHGISGLSQAAAVAAAKTVGIEMGIATPKDVLKTRRDLCRSCADRTKSDDPKWQAKNGLTSWSMCLVCHCNIAAKTSLLSESCPKGLW